MDTDAKLTLLLEKADENHAQLSKLDKKVDDVHEQLNDLKSKLTTIEGKVNTNETSINTLKTKQIEDERHLSNIDHMLAEYKVIIDDNKKNCEFMSDKYETLKDTPTKIQSMQKENVLLKQSIDNLNNQLEQEKAIRNTEQQYHRTSLNIKLCGIPVQPGEEDSRSVSNMVTLDVIKHVCDAANITFNTKAVDVCHRLGNIRDERRAPPIIIRFNSKRDRFDFSAQKTKLKEFTTADVDFSKFKTELSSHGDAASARGGFDRRGRGRGGRGGGTGRDGTKEFGGSFPDIVPIYMQDHLTKFNKDLLKSAKQQLKEVGYEFPGYVMNGEVRAKFHKELKHVPINCESDIKKLVQQAQ